MIAQPLTLETLLERYYLPFLGDTVAEATVRQYRSDVRQWTRHSTLGNADVRRLCAADMTTFADNAVSRGRTPDTVDKWFRTYRAILHFCADEGHIDRVVRMRPLATDEKIKWRPSHAELNQLYDACGAAQWPQRCGGPGQWWRTFLVLTYVGALRNTDTANRLLWREVMPDGIHGRRQKRKRLTFVPMLPCVRRHLDEMDPEPGSSFILPCPGGPRQFREAYQTIAKAAGVPQWTPHATKRAATDAWFDADESGTAGHIISHARWSVTIRSYLDRVRYLARFAPRLEIPAAFNGRHVQPEPEHERFLSVYKRLAAKDREAVAALMERLVG